MHTPGPWKIMLHHGETGIYDVANNFKLAVVEDWREEAKPEAEANAVLIAAAPELLLDLKGLVDDLERIGFGDEDAEVNGGDCVEMIAEWLPQLRGMIACAEGRA